MPEQRFRETSESSFFGALIYDRIVPANHFLRLLKGMVEWASRAVSSGAEV